ncbi:hypothetical protein BV22DRAFT_920412 [Leucogyrophana mollusca]|uniref:Uncharacterized protein n=1 Tax=Leucogyrophana mollusca TaxID=85980 RepID=A0ACB8AXL0_9AGAM|nr:hypothetical protein BV22DRAFT_920412 [Leucogyrophana mollusca]
MVTATRASVLGRTLGGGARRVRVWTGCVRMQRGGGGRDVSAVGALAAWRGVVSRPPSSPSSSCVAPLQVRGPQAPRVLRGSSVRGSGDGVVKGGSRSVPRAQYCAWGRASPVVAQQRKTRAGVRRLTDPSRPPRRQRGVTIDVAIVHEREGAVEPLSADVDARSTAWALHSPSTSRPSTPPDRVYSTWREPARACRALRRRAVVCRERVCTLALALTLDPFAPAASPNNVPPLLPRCSPRHRSALF